MIDSPEPLTNAEIFFGGDESVVSVYEASLADSMNLLRDRTGMSEAETDALTLETSHFFNGAGIKNEFASRTHNLIVKNFHTPPIQQKSISGRRSHAPSCASGIRMLIERMKLASEYLASFPARSRSSLSRAGWLHTRTSFSSSPIGPTSCGRGRSK